MAIEVTTTTVGMLFSDIEGSTRLLQQLGADYARVLLEHYELLRAAFAAHDGDEQGTEGDSFFVTFPSAGSAVAAALAGQRALADHTWPPDATVRVRMGVHIGEIQTVAGTIVGMAVHEGARIGAAAHGGQVLVSATAAELAGTLPDGAEWRDLGAHRLKDIAEAVRLLQLDHTALPSDFPPPRAQSAGRDNLPAQTSAFIGRDTEVAEVDELLRATRLLTLTGAGGAGKSRLALRTAAEQGARFFDGVWFIDLAPISDPAAVPAQFTTGLALSADAAGDLGSAIGQRTMLLLVDNCEHLVAAVCETVDALLRACPNVTVLATSREPLGIHGEVAWRVPSLEGDDALELFCTRAKAVNPRFEITDANRPTVLDVCARLDGIPLALELAAARLGSLSVEQLADRLDQRFRLLAGGARSAMARQRTLQATVDWSYDLLDPRAQTVLRQLGVFVGGFTLEAAEAVCNDVDTYDLLDQLVAKSLVVADVHDGAVRYRLLETIRQYALDRLVQAGETERARDAHLAWARRLATDAEGPTWFGGPDTLSWLERLDADEGNLRAAFDWAVEGARLHDATELVLQLFGWVLGRGRFHEWLERTRRVLATPVAPTDRAMLAFTEHMYLGNVGFDGPDALERRATDMSALAESRRPWLESPARAYVAVARVSEGLQAPADGAAAVEAAVDAARGSPAIALGMSLQALVWARGAIGDVDGAEAAATDALAVATAADLAIGESRMALNLAQIALDGGNLDRAWRMAEQAVDAAQRTGDPTMRSAAVHVFGYVRARQGDLRAAVELLLADLDANNETPNDRRLAGTHNEIAWFSLLRGEAAQADLHAQRAIDLLGADNPVATPALHTAGEAARLLGNTDRAWRLLRDAATLAGGDMPYAAAQRPSILRAMAVLQLDCGHPEDAAVLFGAGGARERETADPGDHYAAMIAPSVAAARDALGAERFSAAYDRGVQLDFAAAIEIADAMDR